MCELSDVCYRVMTPILQTAASLYQNTIIHFYPKLELCRILMFALFYHTFHFMGKCQNLSNLLKYNLYFDKWVSPPLPLHSSLALCSLPRIFDRSRSPGRSQREEGGGPARACEMLVNTEPEPENRKLVHTHHISSSNDKTQCKIQMRFFML